MHHLTVAQTGLCKICFQHMNRLYKVYKQHKSMIHTSYLGQLIQYNISHK